MQRASSAEFGAHQQVDTGVLGDQAFASSEQPVVQRQPAVETVDRHFGRDEPHGIERYEARRLGDSSALDLHQTSALGAPFTRLEAAALRIARIDDPRRPVAQRLSRVNVAQRPVVQLCRA
jgi:hypothetical protein